MDPSEPVPLWKRRAHEALREAILSAARSAFAERGYEGTTVDEIAARARVGKGTIYNYVEGGKAGLLAALVEDHVERLRALVVRSFVEGEGTVRYRYWTLALAVATYFRENAELLRFQTLEVPRLLLDPEAGPVAARLERLTGEFLDVVVPALEAAGGTGEVPVRLAAYHLLVTLFGALTALGLGPAVPACARDLSPGELADVLTALVFDGLPLGRPP